MQLSRHAYNTSIQHMCITHAKRSNAPGLANPVVSMMTWSIVSRRSHRLLRARTRSSRTVQHRQPLDNSVTCSPVPSSTSLEATSSESMLISPNSFSMTMEVCGGTWGGCCEGSWGEGEDMRWSAAGVEGSVWVCSGQVDKEMGRRGGRGAQGQEAH